MKSGSIDQDDLCVGVVSGFRRSAGGSSAACGVTIATFCPTIRLSSVDLPTLVRPAIVTNPARCLLATLASIVVILPSFRFASPRLASARPTLAPGARPRSAQGRSRRRLLALLFAAALAHAEFATAYSDARGETLGVVRTARGHQLVYRLPAEAPIRDFLKFGLVITLCRGPPISSTNNFSTTSWAGRQTTVNVNRADHGLECRRENRSFVAPAAFLFAFAQAQCSAQSDFLRLEPQAFAH